MNDIDVGTGTCVLHSSMFCSDTAFCGYATVCTVTELSHMQRCVAAGCSLPYIDGLLPYGFSKDPELRKKWTDKVKQTRNKWKPTNLSGCAASILKMNAPSHSAS